MINKLTKKQELHALKVEEGWTMDNYMDYKRELFRFIERREWCCEP